MAWLPFVTAEYVNATGDSAILSELVPFLSADSLRKDEHDRYAPFAPSNKSASLFEHCRRAIGRTLARGEHGLPLMGDGDWNDGMNRVGQRGRGESVWLAWFCCATMTRYAGLCEQLGQPAEAVEWREQTEVLRRAIEESAWDGQWYLRAFHDDGSALGSAKNRECRIDSIAQSWAVLSEVGDPVRARRAMSSVASELVREDSRLLLLLWPPFRTTPHDPGYIRAYPPGVRENGGQYTHAATWIGWAYAALGDGEQAERVFRLLNPILRALTRGDAERYAIEPYVLAGDIYGAPPFVGRGGWSWYTGSAAWANRLGVEAILGLRSEGGHLRVDPCIPPAWPGFEAWLRFGEQRIHLIVENPDGAGRGIASVCIDGVFVASNLVIVEPHAPTEREVRIRLGEARNSELATSYGPKAPSSAFDNPSQRREPAAHELADRPRVSAGRAR
jgi:cyclic beta-1,2-glucan synthetase